MSMIIQHNMTAINANRQLGVTTGLQSKSSEKLASGYRINRAADDAAGLAISEKMRSQVRGLNKASDNAQDGVSLIQTAEGALTEAHSILQRMNELAVQGANDTNQTIDRESINEELNSLTEELDRISETTQFNKYNLLDGTFKGKKLQVGANTNQFISITIKSMNATAIGLTKTTVSYSVKCASAQATGFKAGGQNAATSTSMRAKVSSQIVGTIKQSGGRIVATFSNHIFSGNNSGGVKGDIQTFAAGASLKMQSYTSKSYTYGRAKKSVAVAVDDYDTANQALSKIQDAINNVSKQRSALGALQNRLDHTISNLENIAENTQSAESRIRDLDMAEEMVEYSKENILAQAGQSMLAQANQSTQGVLSLLQ